MFSPYGKNKRCYYLKATMQRKQEPHGFGITMTIVSVTPQLGSRNLSYALASLPKTINRRLPSGGLSVND